jgi:periplasmic copper chaperone A
MNIRLLQLLTLAGASAAAHAHVTLPPGGATAGTLYPAAFRVGHACADATATTAIKVRVPAGFTIVEAAPRPGWSLAVEGGEVAWMASSPQAALPAKERTQFVVRGRLTGQPGPLWFKVLQVCDKGQADWAQVPATDADKPEFPAARLDVLPPGAAPVDVREAWARPTVAGQTSTGVFAKFISGPGLTLVGGASPLAASVKVHEMKLEGDVMRMRALDRGLTLPPGEAVELKPGGYHLMVTGLKQPLAVGGGLPVTLKFVDAEGRSAERSLVVPVVSAPAGQDGGHRH